LLAVEGHPSELNHGLVVKTHTLKGDQIEAFLFEVLIAASVAM